MKTVGLITEYNPLHNGHVYHLKKALEITGADTAIVVMSGNYVQRGEPAVVDKYSRAKACVDAGISLCVELPVFYSLSSAELFAKGAVMILDALHVDSIVFGSECGNIDLFEQVADILYKEPMQYSELLKKEVAKGYSYPKARELALKEYMKKELYNNKLLKKDIENIEQMLSSPNNILGIEYVKAIKLLKSQIKPYTITRMGNGYHDTALSDKLPSASGIRHILENNINDIRDTMPKSMEECLINKYKTTCPININDFSFILNYKLSEIFYSCKYNKEQVCETLSQYYDVTDKLSNRIYEKYSKGLTFSELCMKLKTKQYTYTRISRCLLHIILEIEDNDIECYKNSTPYIRILAFDSKGQAYLRTIKKDCSVPIITKTADYKDILMQDIFASDIYNHVVYNKYGHTISDEFRAGIYRRTLE